VIVQKVLNIGVTKPIASAGKFNVWDFSLAAPCPDGCLFELELLGDLLWGF
jgi:hypothetical protein